MPNVNFDLLMKSAKKKKKPGLYANIHAKQERIAHGSGEHMRKPGSKGAPSEHSFSESAKTTQAAKRKKKQKKKPAAKKKSSTSSS